MQAGKMNRRIAIESPAAGQDSVGQPVTGWTFQLAAWAEIKGLSGKEIFVLGAGFSGQLTHRITIRYTAATIDDTMRVLYGARTFLVQLVQNPDEANVQLDLICLEQTA